ncbi:MAG: mismatch-specific DNA-glycosylase [Halofilum sp. (in: g-proteobacteria)]|nr:mismatch-specific DNA-glycosylase [Halofilum sp. (in: g-proteobacteria)]
METLPDYLDHGLDLLVIGQNPSPASIDRQCYYGNPRNRFWPAMRAAGLVPGDFEPGANGFRRLLAHERIGFTDVVKRPTRGAGDLRATDFREWAPVLDRHLREYRPRIAWFNGKGVFESYLRYGRGQQADEVEFGRQPDPCRGRVRSLTPDPSPANARFSLEDLTGWYRQVAELRAALRAPRHAADGVTRAVGPRRSRPCGSTQRSAQSSPPGRCGSNSARSGERIDVGAFSPRGERASSRPASASCPVRTCT